MASRKLDKIERRLLVLLFLLVIFLLSVAGRLIFVQGVEAKKYNSLARKQRIRSVELAPDRGTIYDRDKQELAISLKAQTVYATPYLINKPSKVATQLSEILEMDKKELLDKLTREDCGFVYLARKIDSKKAKAIKVLEIDGIGLIEESKRYYPCKTLASQVVGFVGTENNGLAGLELYLDKYLRGIPGKIMTEKDPLGRDIPGGYTKLSPSSNGNSAILTIDKEIQYKAEVELNRSIQETKAKAGSIIVMNPNTGEIYAIANTPSFDLNNFSQAKADSIRNRAVTDVYEPGSTLKTFVIAAAIEEGLFAPSTCFYLPGTIKVADRVIGEAHARGGRNFTLADIIKYSSNVGAATVGIKLGKERIYQYLTGFGLTEKTGIDFPGEGDGYLLQPSEWSGSTIGTVPFGQGISVTGLELTRAYGVIANDGMMVRPYLVSKVISPQKHIIKSAEEQEEKPVITPQTAREMRYMLEKVVADGTGTNAQIVGYRVGGKTGTAQKPKINGKGYDPGRYVASFVGFAPVEDPQVLVTVIIDEPQATIWGGSVAAPVFKNVTEFSLHHLKIQPN